MINLSKISFYASFIALLFGMLLVPKYGADYFNGTIKCIGISLLALGFAIYQFVCGSQKIKLDWVDISWLSLFAFSVCSVPFATNENQALYGCFTTLILFFSYHFFIQTDWTSKRVTSIYFIALLGVLSSILIQIYNLRNNFFSDHWLIGDSQFLSQIGDVNHHWLGGLMMVLLPFLLFQKGIFKTILGFGLLSIALFLATVAGSAQVMIAGIFLIVIYAIYQSNIPFKKVLYYGVGSLAVLSICLIVVQLTRGDLKGISFVLDEFYEQSDRFWMWKGSISLFQESPIIGVGQNNWGVAVGQFGYNDCYYCSPDNYAINRFVHAHNGFFQILSEQGIIGLICYMGLGIIPLYNLTKGWNRPDFLTMAAASSITIFLTLSAIYGIIYNYFDHFQGIPIIAVFCLAILAKSQPITSFFNVPKGLYYGIFGILAFINVGYFTQFKIAKEKFETGKQQLIGQYNLGQIEQYFFHSLEYASTTHNYQQLAALYDQMGYKDLALISYQNALAQDPNNVLLLSSYAQTAYNLKQYQPALKAAQTAYHLANRYVPNAVLLVQCYLKINDLESAQKVGIPLGEKLLDDLSSNPYQPNLKGIGNELARKNTFHLNLLNEEFKLNGLTPIADPQEVLSGRF